MSNGTAGVEDDMTPEQKSALDKVNLDAIRSAIAAVDFSKVGGGENVWLVVLLKHRALYPGKNRPGRITAVKAKETLNADSSCPWCGRSPERTLIEVACPGPGTKEEDVVQ